MRHTKFRLGVLLLALASSVQAQQNIHFGNVAVAPRVSLEEKYDDNIFLQPASAGTQDSQIVHFVLGSGLSVEGARGKLYLGYDLGILHYDRFSSVNDAVENTAVGGGSYQLANGGKLGAENKFLNTTDPASSELVARAKRNQNDTSASAEFPVGGQFYVSAMALNTVHNYLQAPLRASLNRDEFSVGPRVGYKLSEKTRTFVDYRYTSYSYDTDSDHNNNTNTITAGAEGDFDARLTGSVQVGAAARSYTNSLAGETGSATVPYLSGQVKWNAPGDYNFAVTGTSQFVESVFNRYYKATSGSLAVAKSFGGGWDAAVLGSYEADAYPDSITVGSQTDVRSDNLTQLGVTANYKFPEIYKLTFGYLYRSRGSNFNSFKYNDNLVSLGLGMEF